MSIVPTSGTWLKASDLKKETQAVIVDEANWVESEYKGEKQNQYVCTVEIEGEKKKLKLTMASCDLLAPAYGKDSKLWVGKTIFVKAMDCMVGGKMRQTIIASPVKEVPSKPVSDDTAWDA